jgi:hypothetical protein
MLAAAIFVFLPAIAVAEPLVLDCAAFPANGTIATLQKRFGPENLSTEEIFTLGGEGETAKATVLFAKDKSRRAVVMWADEARRKGIIRVVLSAPDGGAPLDWQADGIRIGSTLADVETINGRPFPVLGFDFDGSGVAADFHGGRLAQAFAKCPLTLRFAPDPTVRGAVRQTVSGDKAFLSSDAVMRAVKPVVEHIQIENTR